MNLRTMQIDNALGDGQAKPGAATTMIAIALIKTVEHVCQIIGGNTSSRIALPKS